MKTPPHMQCAQYTKLISPTQHTAHSPPLHNIHYLNVRTSQKVEIDPDLAPEYPLDCVHNAAVEHTHTTRINSHFVRQTYHASYIPVKVIVPSTLVFLIR